jgi:hypothetical protein
MVVRERDSDTNTSEGWAGLACPDEPALDEDDDEVEHDPDERDRQERGEHERDIEQ